MIKIAVYGKGGIGKSTTVSNISASLADKGMRVMQIGCDPKADSTANLHGGTQIPTVLGLVRERQDGFSLDDMVTIGYKGIVCVEAGGPKPGLGCADRSARARSGHRRKAGVLSHEPLCRDDRASGERGLRPAMQAAGSNATAMRAGGGQLCVWRGSAGP